MKDMIITKITHKGGRNYYGYMKDREEPVDLKHPLFNGMSQRLQDSNIWKRTAYIWKIRNNGKREEYLGSFHPKCQYEKWYDITNDKDMGVYEGIRLANLLS